MKKFILLLIVISFTALEAQDYQYFTAKQGIPKAMEIAKQYFQSDSVELYEIKCVRINDYYGYREEDIDEDYDPYNDNTGKSLFWYYRLCNSQDSCLFIRIKNNNEFITDTMWGMNLGYNERPITIDSIFIDSDSLATMYDKEQFQYPRRLVFFHLISIDNYYSIKICQFENSNVWNYRGSRWMPWEWVIINYNISAVSGRFCDLSVDVPEKNNTNSNFIITSEPNTDNIIIEINSDLFQDAELRLYNQLGVLHYSDIIREKKYNLNTYKVPSGLYILQIKYGGNVFAKTILILH